MAWLAAVAAGKKAAWLATAIIAWLPLSIMDLQAAIGERGIAVLFSLIAGSIRWFRFRPGATDVVTGYIVGAVAAFIAAKWRVPFLDAWVTMAPEDVWMLNGAFFGTFSMIGYTFVIEFGKNYAKRSLPK